VSGYDIRTLKRDAQIVAIEHMDAVSIVMAMRQAATMARTLPAEQREQWLARFKALRQEADAACIAMEKLEPDVVPPEFLLEGVESPEFETRYLKPARDAEFHE
jgi:hypothetical protein